MWTLLKLNSITIGYGNTVTTPQESCIRCLSFPYQNKWPCIISYIALLYRIYSILNPYCYSFIIYCIMCKISFTLYPMCICKVAKLLYLTNFSEVYFQYKFYIPLLNLNIICYIVIYIIILITPLHVKIGVSRISLAP